MRRAASRTFSGADVQRLHLKSAESADRNLEMPLQCASPACIPTPKPARIPDSMSPSWRMNCSNDLEIHHCVSDRVQFEGGLQPLERRIAGGFGQLRTRSWRHFVRSSGRTHRTGSGRTGPLALPAF